MNITNDPIWYDFMPTPVGRLLLVADRQGLREIGFETGRQAKKTPEPHWLHAPAELTFARRQLDDYFAGNRQRFELPLHPHGTPFQLAVWRQLAHIPYATTISYAELAKRIEQPRATRAVGASNGRNPLPIVLPCHRVIGSNGSLTGFGGGLSAKRFLLALEQHHLHGELFQTASA